MEQKRIAQLYLKEDGLVPGAADPSSPAQDAASLVHGLAKEGYDALLLKNLTDARNDETHGQAMRVLTSVCEECGLFIAAGFNVTRTEDVKKILYAGADAAVILTGKETSEDAAARQALIEESVSRFGRESILSGGDDQAVVDAVLSALEARRLSFSVAFSGLKKNEQGLVPAIVRDVRDGEVLMLAYMDEEAYGKTCETGRMHYYSRERKKLWMKGEESGHFQYVKRIKADCDMDTLLCDVRQIGAACHTGNRSCFFNEVCTLPVRDTKHTHPQQILSEVFRVIGDRKAHPKEGSYTNYLFDKGLDKILKKLGEESTEIVIAAKNESKEELTYEISDYLYHLMVLMSEKELTWEEIADALRRR